MTKTAKDIAQDVVITFSNYSANVGKTTASKIPKHDELSENIGMCQTNPNTIRKIIKPLKVTWNRYNYINRGIERNC